MQMAQARGEDVTLDQVIDRIRKSVADTGNVTPPRRRRRKDTTAAEVKEDAGATEKPNTHAS